MSSLVLSFKLYALAVVISFLVALLIKVIVSVLSASRKKPNEGDTAAAQSESPPEPAVSDIPAITAAVYAMIGDHRIVHIESGRSRGAWVQEGRSMHQASHGVQHSPKQK